MSAAHTPGPWCVESDRSVTAWTPEGSRVPLPTITIAHVHSGGTATLAEADANAQLIAAAPDLLLALRRILLEDGLEQIKHLAADAIAQASGGAA
jgi:hypothetical protein